MLGLAVKNFKAAIVTMLNAIQEIQSYYECMLIMDEKKCHQKNKTCFKKKAINLEIIKKVSAGGGGVGLGLTEPTENHQ